MPKVEPKCYILITLEVDEAETLHDALQELPEGHPTDTLYEKLDEALDAVPDSMRE